MENEQLDTIAEQLLAQAEAEKKVQKKPSPMVEVEKELQEEEQDDNLAELNREIRRLKRKLDEKEEKKSEKREEKSKEIYSTDNHILADFQQRLVRVEYELHEIRTRLFSPSVANPTEMKLNHLGKSFRRANRR